MATAASPSFLDELRGKKVTVHATEDVIYEGILTAADTSMNLAIKDATMYLAGLNNADGDRHSSGQQQQSLKTQKHQRFATLFVKGGNVLFVDIE